MSMRSLRLLAGLLSMRRYITLTYKNLKILQQQPKKKKSLNVKGNRTKVTVKLDGWIIMEKTSLAKLISMKKRLSDCLVYLPYYVSTSCYSSTSVGYIA